MRIQCETGGLRLRVEALALASGNRPNTDRRAHFLNHLQNDAAHFWQASEISNDCANRRLTLTTSSSNRPLGNFQTNVATSCSLMTCEHNPCRLRDLADANTASPAHATPQCHPTQSCHTPMIPKKNSISPLRCQAPAHRMSVFLLTFSNSWRAFWSSEMRRRDRERVIRYLEPTCTAGLGRWLQELSVFSMEFFVQVPGTWGGKIGVGRGVGLPFTVARGWRVRYGAGA